MYHISAFREVTKQVNLYNPIVACTKLLVKLCHEPSFHVVKIKSLARHCNIDPHCFTIVKD